MNKKEKARVHKDLDGLELSVDSFGEISSNMPIDKLNKFLNKNVEDKKLRDRDDLDELKKEEE
ncbi:MAG: hypothetical protein RLN88_02770 [Ekhidna sp.]|uniref:hypothetical protein n=1 Tax=Ekhidna sp. TaxID=2608089 RepID=UPI0032EF0BAF